MEQVDKIVSISDDVTKAFLEQFPSLEDKIVRINNILSPEFVRKRAEQIRSEDVLKEMAAPEGTVRLLSVGRFCEAKNYDNVPDICRRIVERGGEVKWFLIGYGGDEPLIRQKIAETGMADHVIILGKKANPYPYMKACDVYVQPSRYEGNSVTVREAQMLGKPVIVTSYKTAQSQVRDGVDGVIVPMDNEGCAVGIYGTIRDKVLLERITACLLDHDYGNEAEIEKVYGLLP